MFNTLEKDLNYGVSQMNAFSVLSLEAELICIQEYELQTHWESREGAA